MIIIFTGIVEEIGRVKKIKRGSNSIALSINACEVLKDVKLGDSIATNGVCLTVTEFDQQSFTVDVMPETMRKSSLQSLKIGTEVNLERALRASDRLGGHIVSGHIDGIGRVSAKQRDDNAIIFTIKTEPDLLKYIVSKGSIAIDGISLTVAKVEAKEFTISIIPHTAEVTILKNRAVGDIVNLEVDIIGKYVENFLLNGSNNQQKKKKGHQAKNKLQDKLRDSGFLG